MVGLNGLEPSTSRLSGVRSNQLSYKPIFLFLHIIPYQNNLDKYILKKQNGGALGIRTLDPLIKSQLLYQLS